jgi:hypothetical protein
MAKASVVKKVKMKPFQKLLSIMISGEPVSKEEIDTLLGKEIQMYRLSTYMWHIKTNPSANGVIKVIKDGRKVAGYQLMNVSEIRAYMIRLGILDESVSKLKDLQAKELPKVDVVAPVVKKMVVTEVTEA